MSSACVHYTDGVQFRNCGQSAIVYRDCQLPGKFVICRVTLQVEGMYFCPTRRNRCQIARWLLQCIWRGICSFSFSCSCSFPFEGYSRHGNKHNQNDQQRQKNGDSDNDADQQDIFIYYRFILISFRSDFGQGRAVDNAVKSSCRGTTLIWIRIF